jgi:hypothetical protein
MLAPTKLRDTSSAASAFHFIPGAAAAMRATAISPFIRAAT